MTEHQRRNPPREGSRSEFGIGTPGRTRPPRRGATKSGFTLVELMVVMFVMMVLVGLAVGVSKHLMDKSAREQTIVTQKILMAAITAYGDQPPSAATLAGVWGQLKAVPAAKERLEKLDPDALNTQEMKFLDGYGNAMKYERTGGLGKRPVLISAGPDGDFDKDADNIRSDAR